MATQLSDMEIDEISLVDDGANPGAKVEIWKAKGMSTFDQKVAQGRLQEGFWRLTDALRESIKEALEGEEPADSVGQSIDAFVAELKKLVPDAQAITKALTGKEQTMNLEELEKNLKAAEAKLDELEKTNKAAADKVTELEGLVKAKDARITDLESTVAKAKGPADADEEFLKSLPAPARDAILKARQAEADAKAELKKAREEKDTAEAIEKAKSLKIGKAEEVGPLLMRVAKGMSNEADAKSLETLLKAAGEQIGKGKLFAVAGASAAVDGDPDELLKAKAAEIKKAKPELTPEAAYAAALEAHPELYSASIAKKRAA